MPTGCVKQKKSLVTVFSIFAVEDRHHVGPLVLQTLRRLLGVVLVLRELLVVLLCDLVPSVNLKSKGFEQMGTKNNAIVRLPLS